MSLPLVTWPYSQSWVDILFWILNFPGILEIIYHCGLSNENNTPTYYTGRKKYEQRQLSWFQYLSLRFLHNIAPWPPNETEWWTVTRQRPDLTYLSNGTWHHYPLCSSPGIIFSDLVDDGFSWYPVGGNAWRLKVQRRIKHNELHPLSLGNYIQTVN